MAGHRITYRIAKRDETIVNYEVELTEDFTLISSDVEQLDWALLENHQCPNCPYAPGDRKYCPVALAISEVLKEVDGAASTDVVNCEVTTAQRTYAAEVDYQKALYSLLGLLMATSGCSKFAFLRPSARFHLPFASLEETIVRTCSIYLLSEYFKDPSTAIEQGIQRLTEHYEQLDQVNHALLSRVRSMLPKGDAHQNAMIVLNSFAQVMSMGSERSMRLISDFFQAGADK